MRTLLSALLMVLPTIAWADFRFLPATGTAGPRFYFSGNITQADRQEFIKALQSLPSVSGALVQLESQGGEALTSLDIADIVRWSRSWHKASIRGTAAFRSVSGVEQTFVGDRYQR
jgi:ClpP class serine protease